MAKSPQGIAGPRWLVWIALSLAGVLTVFCVLLPPWQQVHPSDPSLRVSLGYAPLWSTRFHEVVGAHLDLVSAAINILVIWVLFGAVMVVLAATKSAE